MNVKSGSNFPHLKMRIDLEAGDGSHKFFPFAVTSFLVVANFDTLL